jgi:hypothetical protein
MAHLGLLVITFVNNLVFPSVSGGFYAFLTHFGSDLWYSSATLIHYWESPPSLRCLLIEKATFEPTP